MLLWYLFISLWHPPRVVRFMQRHRKTTKNTMTSFSQSGLSYKHEKEQVYPRDSPFQVANGRGLSAELQSCGMDHASRGKRSERTQQLVVAVSGLAMAERASPWSSPKFFQLKDWIGKISWHIPTHSSVKYKYASPTICFNLLKEPFTTLDPL